MVCGQTIRIRRFFTSPLGLLIGLLALASGGSGCSGGKNPSSTDPEAAHIIKVAELVKEYETAKDIPPGSIEELKTWALKEGKAQDSDFVSTRDKEAYVLEVSGGGKPKKGSQIIVHEATGMSRKKYNSVAGSGVATEKPDSYFGYLSGESAKDVKKQQEERRHQPKGQQQ
jgi:hypothetical protein